MKTLNVLVGYLAVTIPPFHRAGPFVLAYPLASIDHYDGYVNTTTSQNHIIDGALMKHVHDSIVETCQTITTQNHSDNTLIKRDIIEARQLAIPVAGFIFFLVADVIYSIVVIALDDRVRGNDVEVPC